ncbi:MAG: photosynthetic complex putative assembly protein PuhB [Pseudomonadota bacterium]
MAAETANTTKRTSGAEYVCWQGRPDWMSLARHAFGLRLCLYATCGLVVWAVVFDLMRTGQVGETAIWFGLIGMLICGLLMVSARITARMALYTVTNRRIVLQIGVVLRVALNLPYHHIRSATLKAGADDTGTISLDLKKEAPVGYAICWPHVLPWRVRQPHPALRCVPEASRIARHIAARVNLSTAGAPAPAPELANDTAPAVFATPLDHTKTATKMEG